VKTNIGHLEMASGIAALIKSSLQIYHKTMVKTLNFENRNEGIDWDSYPLKVCQENTPLVGFAKDGAIVGTVSSFGFGGSNSVLVLESYPGEQAPEEMAVDTIPASYKFPFLYPLGSMTLNATTEFQKLVVDTITQNIDSIDNYDLGLALALGKRSRIYSWRSTAVTSAVHELTAEKFTKPELVVDNPHLCFVFSGQGPQHARMGYGLYLRYEAFRDSVDRADEFIKNEFQFSPIKDFGLFDESQQSQDSWPILKVVVSITILQIALYDLWVSVLGRKPDSVLGHSVGEIAMLYASGAVSVETCLRIAVGRARAMEMVDGNSGGMVALGCSSTTALEFIGSVLAEAGVSTGLWLAADNSEDAITVAGEKPLVEKLSALASGKNVFARVLKVGSAFHTPLMEVCKEKMMTAMNDAFSKEISSKKPTVAVSSTVYGRLWDSETPFDADYMWKNMRQPVCFRQAVQSVVTAYKNVVVLEMAAHPVLATSVTSQLDSRFMISSMIRPNSGSTGAAVAEIDVFLNAAGRLFCLGFNPDFKLLSGEVVDERNISVNLPEYPFHEKHIWPPESRACRSERLAPATTRLGSKIMELSTKKMPWFSYHVIDGITLLPGAAYMSAIFERGARVLRNVSFEKMMSFSQDQTVVALCDVDFDLCRWSIKSSSELNTNPDMGIGEADFNNIHSRGDFSLFPPEMAGEKGNVDVADVMARCHIPKFIKDMDERRKHYYQFGDIFSRTIKNVFVSDAYDELVCDLVLPQEFIETGTAKFAVHPGMVDAMFQAVFFLAMEADSNCGRYEHKWLPHKLGRIVRLDENDGSSFDFSNIRVLVKKGKLQGDLMISDLSLFCPTTGRVSMTMENCVFKLVPAISDEFVIEESLYETFVQYGMPAVEFEVPKLVDVERNTRLYQYTDATAYNYIFLNAGVVNQESSEGDSIDRVRFRKFCQTVLKSFPGPFLKDFNDAEIAAFNEENMVVVTERIGHLIPEILKDSSAGVASLFSDEVFTKLYDGDIWTQEFNLLIRKNFKECLMQAKSQGKRVLRVLEVGAGSGGLTAFLDPILIEADSMGMHIDYLATDVTVSFGFILDWIRVRFKSQD
jgi:fatty acid synthase, animal type